MSRNKREGRYCGTKDGAHRRTGTGPLIPLRGTKFIKSARVYMDGRYIGDATNIRIHVNRQICARC